MKKDIKVLVEKIERISGKKVVFKENTEEEKLEILKNELAEIDPEETIEVSFFRGRWKAYDIVHNILAADRDFATEAEAYRVAIAYKKRFEGHRLSGTGHFNQLV